MQGTTVADILGRVEILPRGQAQKIAREAAKDDEFQTALHTLLASLKTDVASVGSEHGVLLDAIGASIHQLQNSLLATGRQQLDKMSQLGRVVAPALERTDALSKHAKDLHTLLVRNYNQRERARLAAAHMSTWEAQGGNTLCYILHVIDLSRMILARMDVGAMCRLAQTSKAGRDAVRGVFFDIKMSWLLDPNLDRKAESSTLLQAEHQPRRMTATRQEIVVALLQ